ncbi:MAG TPA: TlpA disulfide reductase family protein [Candidatus Acidoferrum sp.]|nr:TlpA disulfide reductase family protein [Candidatus Acidoferrum sp.]
MGHKLTIRDVVLLALLAAATIALTWKAKALEKRFLGHSDEPALTNKQAPEFEGQTLGGEAIASRDFKGKKKIVVSFWASWCEPCRMELPELSAFYEKYHTADSRFEVMAVSTDTERFQAEKYVKEAKLPFPVVWDERGTIGDKFGVESIPVLYVIDENGKVIYGQMGYGFGLEPKLRITLGLKDSDAKKAGADDDSSN